MGREGGRRDSGIQLFAFCLLCLSDRCSMESEGESTIEKAVFLSVCLRKARTEGMISSRL